MYRLRDWPKGEESEQNRCTRCRVCHSRNSYPGIVCNHCYERHLEEEAELLIDELCEPAREEQVYKQNSGGHALPATNDLLRAAIAESYVGLKRANFEENVRNLMEIAIVLRERIERFKSKFEREKNEARGYCPSIYMGPSLIDHAFDNCYSERQEYRRKEAHS